MVVDYSRIEWLPLCVGLAVLGLGGSWLAWRRRGAAAGLRGAGWSLIPLAAYLTGMIDLLWQVGAAVTRFAVRFVLSPTVWAGVVVTGLAATLLVISTVLRRRGIGRRPAIATAPGNATVPAAPIDDDLAEIEELLRRRGIR